GLAVVVLTATTPPSALPGTPAVLGAAEQPEPQNFAPEPTEELPASTDGDPE
ncbi:ABC transport system ATP-binding protein, partial [Amycolatopsis vancoresmycina DSM 44592]